MLQRQERKYLPTIEIEASSPRPAMQKVRTEP